jgi:hypothetical protein
MESIVSAWHPLFQGPIDAESAREFKRTPLAPRDLVLTGLCIAIRNGLMPLVWIGVSAIGILAFAIAADALYAHRVRAQHLKNASQAWKSARPTERQSCMRQIVDRANGIEMPGAAWYLLGCALLREGRPQEAVRALGTACHCDFRIESAALLTFAALKVASGMPGELVEHMVATWREMKEPRLLRRREDRILLDCLEATTRDPPALSALGRVVWAVSSPVQQSRIESALKRSEAWTASLCPPVAGGAC